MTDNSFSPLYERFNRFQDALLREVKVAYFEDGKKFVSISVYARDWSADTPDTWRVVMLQVIDVISYRLAEQKNTTAQVLSNGIHCIFANEHVGVELGDFVDVPTSLDELGRSNLHILGKSIEARVCQ
jgi:hypothetical protein